MIKELLEYKNLYTVQEWASILGVKEQEVISWLEGELPRSSPLRSIYHVLVDDTRVDQELLRRFMVWINGSYKLRELYMETVTDAFLKTLNTINDVEQQYRIVLDAAARIRDLRGD